MIKNKSLQKIKNILLFSLFALLFIEVLIGFPVPLEKKVDPFVTQAGRVTEKESTADQQMTDIHLTESGGNQVKKWELWAKVAEGYEGRGAWELHSVEVHFYSKSDVSFRVKGDFGTIDTKTKDLVVQGHVLTTSSNQYKFASDKIIYTASQHSLVSPSLVQMETPADKNGSSMKVKGGRMRGDIATKFIWMDQGVSAQKLLQPGKNLEIESMKVEMSGQDSKMSFSNNVFIQYLGMHMKSPRADFQFSNQGGALSNIQMLGGVHIQDVEKTATSETVFFDPVENKYIFRGNPKLTQDQDELIGDEIVFLNGGKQVKVDKIKAKLEDKPHK